MIYVIAYLKKNFGDDLFVYTLLKRYPKELFYICADEENAKGLANLTNARFPNKLEYNLLRVFNKITKGYWGFHNILRERNARALVTIGGSIFIENAAKKFEKRINKKRYIIGANYGPAYTKKFKELVKEEISNSVICSFRDSYSYNEFADLDNVMWAPDIIFSLKTDNRDFIAGQIGISVIDLSIHKNTCFNKEKYESLILDFCKMCLEKNIRVKLFSFCEYEGDSKIIDSICSKIEKNNLIEKVEYDGNIDTFLDKLNECEFIIASRFHAMILGWVLGKKVLPVVYSKKHLNVIEDIQYSGPVIDLMQELSYTSNDIEAFLAECEVLNSVSSLSKEAELHFRELDKLLLN
ncbi:MAG: polysaccharide pyruvyl transferase family protein [Clostridia bacterium]|nr:polysaccharide pyruvyl transferase family protein [Clostridia bacterium]